jgi:hypothetical protein
LLDCPLKFEDVFMQSVLVLRSISFKPFAHSAIFSHFKLTAGQMQKKKTAAHSAKLAHPLVGCQSHQKKGHMKICSKLCKLIQKFRKQRNSQMWLSCPTQKLNLEFTLLKQQRLPLWKQHHQLPVLRQLLQLERPVESPNPNLRNDRQKHQ